MRRRGNSNGDANEKSSMVGVIAVSIASTRLDQDVK